MEATLNQKSVLFQTLKEDENLSKHFIFDEAGRDNLENLTDAQCRYFHYLLFNKKYIKLNSLLTQFGFRQIK